MRLLIAQALAAFARLLYKRTILILTLIFCLGLAGALWNMKHLSMSLMQSQALQNAALYAQAIAEARTLYSSEAVARLEATHGITATHDYATQEGAIPLPATYLIELGQYLSKQNPGMSVRLYSDLPFPWRREEGGPRDKFERDALRKLRQNPKEPFFSFETFQGRPSLRYAQADILQPSCVSCHNSAFDRLSEQHGLEKIKTIGDAYMVVGGIPKPRSDHAEAIAEMALDIQQEVTRFNAERSIDLSIRIGINTGPVVAGVIGTKKFIYDLWGDAVNTASRMESHGIAGAIQVTGSTYERLRNNYYFEKRGVIHVKGKGEMTTYLLTGRKSSL